MRKHWCCHCDASGYAVALGRWALGILFFFSGLGKCANPSGFANGYLAPAFADTFLPGFLVTAYGYALPYAELVLGALLLLGLFRNTVLTLTGLTLISLAFGQMLLKEHATVANIFVYIAITGLVLFAERWDTLRLGRCARQDDET